ncbi:MAG: arsenate reductase family protein [Maritimibacter sp.]
MKDLAAAGHAPELVDVRATPLSPADLARFEAAFGEALLNTRSTTWRGLDAAARARPMADLLAEFPALMKRPVVESGENLTLGWDAAAKSVWL